ncbi:MAG TPA: hypothetical protein VED46_18215 [Alphaproteobacteria bacterium]|nr:hypothetical protein [Alphaproteobacteria bacterium]
MTDHGQAGVDPFRMDLVEEFRHRPIGAHSGDLQRLLNLMRGEPLKGKYVLVCAKPGTWMLAQLSGVRGGPVSMMEHEVFHSREQAEWAVFKLRWRRLTGRQPDF